MVKTLLEQRELLWAVFFERAAAREQLPTAGGAASNIAAQVMMVASCRPTITAAWSFETPTWLSAVCLSSIHDPVERELGDSAASAGGHFLFAIDASCHVMTLHRGRIAEQPGVRWKVPRLVWLHLRWSQSERGVGHGDSCGKAVTPQSCI